MMRYTIIAIFIFYLTSLLGQSERVNCILFVDGKLPDRSQILMEGLILCGKESDTIKFHYNIGEIRLSKVDFQKVKKSQKLAFLIRHFRNDLFRRSYRIDIRSSWVENDYLILRIHNSGSGYTSGITTSGFSSEFSAEEYYMLDDY